jgi:hypothetical protein
VPYELPADALRLRVEVQAAVQDLVEHGDQLGHHPVAGFGHLAEVAVSGGGHGGEQGTQV